MRADAGKSLEAKWYDDRGASVMGWAALVALLGPILIELALKGNVALSWFTTLAHVSAFVLAPALGIGALLRRLVGRERRARVAKGELRIAAGAQETAVPRSQVRGGVVSPDPRGGASVELELDPGRVLKIHTTSLVEGDALLRTLGLDPSARCSRIGVARRGLRVGLGAAVSIGMFYASMALLLLLGEAGAIPKPLSPGMGVAWVLAVPFATWVAMRLTDPGDVLVGADGVSIRRPWRGKRFISYDDMVRVEQAPGLVRIALRDGTTAEIGAGMAKDDSQLHALARRIGEALAARADAGGSPAKLALLGRNGRTVADWREDLRRATTTDDYRSVPITSDDLHAILDGGTASPDEAVGAALALRIADPERAQDRIRIAADRTANDETKAALEALAEDEVEDDRVALVAGG